MQYCVMPLAPMSLPWLEALRGVSVEIYNFLIIGCSLLRDRSSVRRHHTDQVSRRSVRGHITHILLKYHASVNVTNSALSGRAYF